MILAFDTEELRTICEDPDAARSLLGDDVASVLRVRLADLRAIDRIDDLLTGWKERAVQDRTILEIELADGVAMMFVPNHNKPRVNEAGLVDWTRVRRIRLTEIGRPT